MGKNKHMYNEVHVDARELKPRSGMSLDYFVDPGTVEIWEFAQAHLDTNYSQGSEPGTVDLLDEMPGDILAAATQYGIQVGARHGVQLQPFEVVRHMQRLIRSWQSRFRAQMKFTERDHYGTQF